MRLAQAQREALERQDARFSSLPMRIPADREFLLAHGRNVGRLLKDRRSASPCSRAAMYVNALFDRSVPEAAKKAIACRKDCAHCCYQPVIVYAPELFLLAAHIRGQDGMAEKLIAAAEAARGQAPGKSAPCPMLAENACTVYGARPLSCHAFVSMNVNDCISYFRYQGTYKVLSPPAYDSLRNMCRIMLLAAMKAAGYPIRPYQLDIASLAAVLAEDNAEKCWLRNESALAEVQAIADDIPAEVHGQIDRFSAAIAPAL